MIPSIKHPVSSRHCRAALILVVLSLFHSATTQAGIVTRTAVFNGPQQTMNVSVELSGASITAQGSGHLGGASLVLDPDPETVSLSLDPNPTTINTNPGATIDLQVDDHTGAIVGLNLQGINVTENAPETINLQPVAVGVLFNGSPLTLPAGGSATVVTLGFFGNSAAAVSGNTFSLNGSVVSGVDETLTVAGAPVYQVGTLNTTYLYTPATGTITTSPLPGTHDERVALDGTLSVSFPAFSLPSSGFPININSGTFFGITGTISGAGSIAYSATFHLETTLTGVLVPEPGSVVLLAIGLLVMVGSALPRLWRPRVARRLLAAAFVVLTVQPLATTQAAPVTQTVSFSGPAQTADFSLQTDGRASASGSGQLSGVPLVLGAQTHPFNLDPNPFTASTHPASAPFQVTVDDHTGELLGFTGLNLDLFGGVAQPFQFQPFNLDILLGGNPVSLPFTASGQFDQLQFLQFGPASVSGNSFTLNGSGNLFFDATLAIAGIPVAQYHDDPLGSSFLTAIGTVTTAPGPNPHDLTVSLDGSGSVVVAAPLIPLLNVSINASPLSFTGNAALLVTRTYEANFHWQTTLTGVLVPEPGSIVLLAIGLAVVGGRMAQAAKRRRVPFTR